ncbi:MAG TPA: glutamate formimidoyltransferase [Saprospiraceae bacterium]|nr:glutamate formimidoyltransferase [Saprospiraceae bacterium]
MKRLIECVPNFREGHDMNIIEKITDEIKNTENVKLLDVDPGKATNRTVVTFVGEPESVIEAAFKAIKKAGELIDMSKHHGEHPRMVATDVCPLIPISGISTSETVEFAKKLAKRVGEELNIPVYLYEEAASQPKRKNLATIRAGEYEGLEKKLKDPEWAPDYGKAEFNKHSGATVIGVRDFLVAYNVNLNTTSTRRANSVAFDIREKGRIKREGDPITGKIVRDENGNPVREPGTLKYVKAIGWYIEEYGIAQVSMNLTNIKETPLHIAFEEAVKSASNRGMRVTGSELVGLVPKKVMIDAGNYFLEKQNRSTGIPEEDIIFIAVKSMGLDELKPFDPRKKIIEYLLEDNTQNKLVNLTAYEFANETSRESPAPGGGSIAAYSGALGASLATMVANLSAHKRGWDSRWKEFSEFAQKGQAIKDKLLYLVDEDTNAFNKIIEAIRMPKNSEEEKSSRKEAITKATKYAIQIPFTVMKTSFEALPLLEYMANKGNPNSVSDAGVGVLAVQTAVEGAYMNVVINCKDLDDKKFVDDTLNQADKILKETQNKSKEILKTVYSKI